MVRYRGQGVRATGRRGGDDQGAPEGPDHVRYRRESRVQVRVLGRHLQRYDGLYGHRSRRRDCRLRRRARRQVLERAQLVGHLLGRERLLQDRPRQQQPRDRVRLPLHGARRQRRRAHLVQEARVRRLDLRPRALQRRARQATPGHRHVGDHGNERDAAHIPRKARAHDGAPHAHPDDIVPPVKKDGLRKAETNLMAVETPPSVSLYSPAQLGLAFLGVGCIGMVVSMLTATKLRQARYQIIE
ncbi:hypothetical protein SPRG_22120 [Saprolegnia parasitica CBS 223.65]|uniref:Uncharacterized protein n=1 Tax=Saprolegnia parasitica (strain CBS 223.65) TaxID=695850 RepID=A0A067CM43_SAPPC|nr:hypothetical protein SPRG_22120 [Saprolegnia parasitica CBS 223.65]KDO31583.1 hypothetical protein SPRG_22120 [Saprolegnia parasitica CBS 223.65]|eukprot:XP_012197780.1 hypothetical protein SPRG_22120 [Saprolegnia parasitica CBS 223.65]